MIDAAVGSAHADPWADGVTDLESLNAEATEVIVRSLAGEISAAKSGSDNFALAIASRAVALLLASERFASATSGSELNSETKLTAQT